jgi:hypothetical protein
MRVEKNLLVAFIAKEWIDPQGDSLTAQGD